MDRPTVVAALLLIVAGLSARAGVLSEKAGAATARKETFVEGAGGWRFLPSELLFADKLQAPDFGEVIQPAVNAIADFSGQLKQVGVALVVVPVPPKILLQAESLGLDEAEKQRMRSGWQTIMENLSSCGVQVVDLLPDYSTAKEPMYCLRDTHWSGPGIEAALERMVPLLQSSGVRVDVPQDNAAPWKDFSIKGDLGGESETVKLRFAKSTPPQNGNSQVLLLGDSHVLVFHQGGELHTTGAGLPEQMFAVLGSMPEVLGVRGSGATSSRLQLARAIKSKPDYLATKKVVIWVFAGREFTEADMWRKVPLSFTRK